MRRSFLSAAVTFAALVFAASAPAAIMVTAVEDGSDVIISGSGSANLDGLTLVNDLTTASGLITSRSSILVIGDATAAAIDSYARSRPPDRIGNGTTVLATSGTGDTFGARIADRYGSVLIVPKGYVSGAPLSGSSMYQDATFASLGLVPGTYVWNWGAGDDADSLTLQVGRPAVPEPSGLTLTGIALCAGLLATRRRAATA